ncbi:MAG: GNAT family N-acetyltransferase, partial [SAR202 cluster bacterium]|nr:GNAT family N-acetyltransferase [SAR202 cluster bacterium]
PALLRYLLTRARAVTLVVELEGAVLGSVVMVWRKNSPQGHLYSIVIDPALQGRGLGGRLLAAAEGAVARRGARTVALETRVDNAAAIALYERRGYRRTGLLRRFYADGADALQMRKHLETTLPAVVRLDVPFYPDGRQPGCASSGRACLAMAIEHHRPGGGPLLSASTPAAHAFEAPLRLALEARRRGCLVRAVVPPAQGNGDRRLAREASEAGVMTSRYEHTVQDVAAALYEGAVPMTLTGHCPLHPGATPHWLVVTGLDQRSLYVHDPFGGPSAGAGHAPIAREAVAGAASAGLVTVGRVGG